jgi:hypothetical protein
MGKSNEAKKKVDILDVVLALKKEEGVHSRDEVECPQSANGMGWDLKQSLLPF